MSGSLFLKLFVRNMHYPCWNYALKCKKRILFLTVVVSDLGELASWVVIYGCLWMVIHYEYATKILHKIKSSLLRTLKKKWQYRLTNLHKFFICVRNYTFLWNQTRNLKSLIFKNFLLGLGLRQVTLFYFRLFTIQVSYKSKITCVARELKVNNIP